jgi:hypothetical protein
MQMNVSEHTHAGNAALRDKLNSLLHHVGLILFVVRFVGV